MKIEKLEETTRLPEGVSAVFTQATHTLTVKGKKGELSRVFFTPRIAMAVTSDGVVFTAPNATMREKKLLFTAAAHTRNMLKGVSEGFVYRLKICSGHFPMSVSVKGDVFEIKNFIGEKVPRTLKLKKDAQVKVEGQEVTVTGVEKELVGQVAADIEQLSRRPGFDNRVFQDGIFIIDKGGKTL
jgi:large subunit ribosomal protein L6